MRRMCLCSLLIKLIHEKKDFVNEKNPPLICINDFSIGNLLYCFNRNIHYT